MTGVLASRRRSPLSVVAVVLATIVLVDLVAAAAVYVDRRNDPDTPHFRRADISGITWVADPYVGAEAILAVPVSQLAPGPVDESPPGIQEDAFDPDLNLTYALAALARADRGDGSVWLRRAGLATRPVVRSLVEGLAGRAVRRGPVADRPAPQYAAATQGLLLSTLARLFVETGDVRWRRSAHHVLRSLLAFEGFFVGDRPAPQTWLSRVDGDGYLWFDRFSEWPDAPNALRDQVATALGVYDYRRSLAATGRQRQESERLLAGSIATIRHYLPRFRVPGLISLAQLAGSGPDVRSHFVVKDQLAMLAKATGFTVFGRYARLLDKDDDLPFFNMLRVRIQDPDVDVYRPLPPEMAIYRTASDAPRVTYAGGVSPRGDSISPTISASYALAQLDDYRRTGDVDALRRAEQAVDEVLGTTIAGAAPYRFREMAGEEILRTPRYSSEGQGLMLSALTRLHEVTGDERWSRQAGKMFAALTAVRGYGVPAREPWMSWIDSSTYLWFDQNAPNVAPFSATDVHLAAVLGIYDYWRMTGSERALQFFIGGVATTNAYVQAFRQPGRPAIDSLRTDSRSPSVHAVITRQMASLVDITGHRRLARYATRLASDYP